MRRIGLIVLLVVGIAELILGAWLAIRLSGQYTPRRPTSMPAVAIYAGGADGGEWVSCRAQSDNSLLCLVYDAKSGEARYERTLRFCPGVQFARHSTRGALTPRFFSAEFAQFDGVAAFEDRPPRYLPRKDDSSDVIGHEIELANKYYADFGVQADCTPATPKSE